MRISWLYQFGSYVVSFWYAGGFRASRFTEHASGPYQGCCDGIRFSGVGDVLAVC